MSKKASAKHGDTRKIPAWVWIFNLALALVFMYFLYYLNSVPATKDLSLPEKPQASSPTPSEVTRPETAKPGQDTRFKFYDMLPETKVEPPNVSDYTPQKQPENIAYMLQTGSFRTFEDAERQRATIGFQGLKAQVEEYRITDDNIWFRVQVGPFKSRSKMNSAVDRLVTINIQPLVKKINTDVN